MHLEYHLRGDGLDEAKARRAIELSITKYCSVVHSLAPDIRITHGLTLG
jgi:putative redox protein